MPENWFEKQKSARAKRRTARHKDIAPRWCPRKSGRGIALPWTLADVGIPASRRILKGGESDPFCVSLLRVLFAILPLSSPAHHTPLPPSLEPGARRVHPSRAELPRWKGAKGRTTLRVCECARARVSAAAYMCVCIQYAGMFELLHVGFRDCTIVRRIKNEVQSLRSFSRGCLREAEGRRGGSDCAKGTSLFPRCMYTSFET